MEQVTSDVNLESLLKELKNTKEVTEFGRILQNIFILCINLDVNQINISEESIERSIKFIRILDKISIYLFSEYNNTYKNYDNETKNKAMELTALVSDKVGDYLKHVNETELTSLNIEKILFKQLKSYWKSSVAYTLGDNAPNSIVIAKKLRNVLLELQENHTIIKDKKDIFTFSYYLLSRQTISNIEDYIEDPALIDIFHNLRKFIQSGEVRFINVLYSILDEQIKLSLELFDTNYYWHLRYVKLCLGKIINNCVWNNLEGIFSRNYIQQLIKSRPPVIELWPNQLEVINNKDSFLKNDSIKRTLVNFPTSGGKSLLAEFAIVKELETDITKKCFYIVPTNALVYEVTKRLRERFRRLGYNVSSSINGYEPDLVYGNYFEEHIIVTTPEKLDMIIKNNLSEDILSETSLIIFDEFQKIQDRSRGWIIEGSIVFLINHLKFKNIKLMFLSAIIDNGPIIINWVDDENGSSSDYIPNSWRPTNKIRGLAKYEYKTTSRNRWISVPEKHKYYKEQYNAFFAQSKIRYLIGQREIDINIFDFPRYHYKTNNTLVKNQNLKYENFIMGVAQKLKNMGGSLIFFHTREECENFVRNYEPYFPEKLHLSQEVKHLIVYIEKRLGINHLLVVGLKKGLVYHHGSLPMDIREALEDYYAKGYIQIMVCTTTLVEGVNFPIQNFIHTGKKYEGLRTLSPGDFKNIVGRAGRAYQSTFGQIIYIDFYRNNGNIIEEHLNYEVYTNNVESSILNDEELFKSIEELESIDSEQRENFITKITEKNFIKSLLLYYNSLSDEVKDVEVLLGNTLFARQIGDEKFKKLTNLSKSVYSFYDTRPREELLRVQESGLSFISFKLLTNIAEEVVENYKTDGPLFFLKDILTKESYIKILSLPESAKFKVKKSTSTSGTIEIDDYNLLIDWVESNLTLQELSIKYFSSVDPNYQMSRIVEYVKDMFEFKLPWVFGTLSSLILEKLGFVNYFAYLPIFIKYGIDNSVDADLFKLGFNSRETVKDLSVHIQTNTTYESLEELKEYLKSIDPIEFLDEKEKLSPFEVRKLVNLTNNYKDITSLLDDGKTVETYLAGTKYYLCKLPNRDAVLIELTNGAGLKLKREVNNFYDEYAIEVYFKDQKIGYIPRKINEEVSYYLDLNTDYSLTIKSMDIVNEETFIDIKLVLSFNLIY
ncbi:DEAD/DEAH box helicase [Neobacillus sp. PS2-9]|uniref:DEAD/DEAH box helicase n=1 Tax=Neobacillus sp. PS2-9 TaxID=3070676 RepID=UPI0027DEACB7|nr:DEAD/DEAH box helicase [Neobacillus sp. PS2-9]WML57449.1 DEAD/DEAH box helicase [Neobacillus sp. PS2-9]